MKNPEGVLPADFRSVELGADVMEDRDRSVTVR
jgi:hypothetical protein